MLSEREKAVERVLNDLRLLLTGRVKSECVCGRAERYTLIQEEVLEARSALARARTLCEFATSTAAQALEQVELTEDLLS